MLLDYNNSGELSIDEFIAGCIRMKGFAKSKDLLAAQVAVDTLKRHFTVFEEEMTELQDKIELLDATARALVHQGEHVFLNLREYRMRHPELEFRSSSPPRIPTSTIKSAPWNLAADALPKNTNHSTQDKLALVNEVNNTASPEKLRQLGNAQEAIHDFSNSDSWAVVEIHPDNSNGMAEGPSCPSCGKPFDSSSQAFCTGCGAKRPATLEDGQLALADGNASNASNRRQNQQLALQDGSRSNANVTDLALPGSFNNV